MGKKDDANLSMDAVIISLEKWTMRDSRNNRLLRYLRKTKRLRSSVRDQFAD